MVVAVGPAMTKFMHEILDVMFQFGLSDSLCVAAMDLSVNIPPLHFTIQSKLNPPQLIDVRPFT